MYLREEICNKIKVVITYCVESNFMPKAANLAVGITKYFGITPMLKEGRDGIFAVEVNGDTVFHNNNVRSKFPSKEEIYQLIGKYQSILNQSPD